jgi:hypothetical protein
LALQRMLMAIPHTWLPLLIADRFNTKKEDHIGIFDNEDNSYPQFVCEIANNSLIQLSKVQVDTNLSLAEICYQVGRRSKFLLPVAALVLPVRGYIKRV